MTIKTKKIIFLSFLVALFVSVLYNFIMHGSERNVATEKSVFTTDSNKIVSEFITDVNSANAKYLEKAIEIEGKISFIKGNEIVLDNTVLCTLIKKEILFKKGSQIKIKGRVVGFDDLISELKIDNCSVIK